MPVSPPTTTYAPDLSFWQIGREKVAAATAAATFLTMPVTDFEPNDTPTWIQDKSRRNSYVKTYDLNQGPIWAEHNVPRSPVYGDTIPLPIYGLFGDYVTTGTAATPTWTTTSALTPGAGPIPVSTGSVAVAGTSIQVDSTTGDTEVVTVGTGSTSTSIVISATTPLRFSHLTGITITTVTAPFSHQFALLGPGSSTGTTEPPSMTINHNTYLPGSGNDNAVQYLYSKFTSLTFDWDASNAFFGWAGKATSYSHAYPGSAPVAAFSGSRAMPSWEATQAIASASQYNIPKGSITFSREPDVIPTADGQQAPYGIFLGGMDATFNLTFNPAISEAPLLAMLNNTRPTFLFTCSNGLTGSSLISVSIAAQLTGYKSSPLKVFKTRFGWDVSGELVGNSTNVGNSGGYGPAVITVQNAIPTF